MGHSISSVQLKMSIITSKINLFGNGFFSGALIFTSSFWIRKNFFGLTSFSIFKIEIFKKNFFLCIIVGENQFSRWIRDRLSWKLTHYCFWPRGIRSGGRRSVLKLFCGLLTGSFHGGQKNKNRPFINFFSTKTSK